MYPHSTSTAARLPIRQQIGSRHAQPIRSGLRAGVFFSLLILPLYLLVDVSLPAALGWLLYVCLLAAILARRALFWLAIGAYVFSGFVYTQSGMVPSFVFGSNSLSLHELLWVAICFGSVFRLLTQRQTGRWPPFRLDASGATKVALSLLVVLAVIATVNTFFFGGGGRWSTAIRFALPALPLILALRAGFVPQDLPQLMARLRQVGLSLMPVVAIHIIFASSQGWRLDGFLGVHSHLIMIGLVYTWLELLLASFSLSSGRLWRWVLLGFGAIVYFILASGALSDMWMFAWAIILGLSAAGFIRRRIDLTITGRVLAAVIITSTLIAYLSGPASFLRGDLGLQDTNETFGGSIVALLGDSGVNLTDRFVRWRIVAERIAAEPFALQFHGYGSEYEIAQAYSVYGYYLSNLVAHNAFLDLALWLTPLAPLLLIFLLWRFWRSMLQSATTERQDLLLLLTTCTVAAPLFWIRDVWGTWIVQGYWSAGFSFWLVVILGWLAKSTIRKGT